MEFNKTSIEEVVGRILRNTKVQDTSYFSDILRWITEAASLMGTKWALQQLYEDQPVHRYRANMPCGLVRLQSIEYNGARLPQRNISKHPSTITPEAVPGTTVYISTVKAVETPSGNTSYLPDGTIVTLPVSTTDWYYEDGPGAVGLSFESGIVRFHYKAVPTDKQGWPLIPDQEDFKEALYWYCRAKLSESGWVDPVLNWRICDEKWMDFSERATAAIKYPSTNRVEEMCDMITLIPPQDYFDTYYNLYR